MEKKNKDSVLNKDLKRHVGSSIALARWIAEMSQSELAEKMGTSKSNISRAESGSQNLTLDYIASIADALGKEVSLTFSDVKMEYGETDEYSLRLFDEELMRFELKRELELVCNITYINEERRDMLPLGLEVSNDGVIDWLNKRVIPKNRDLVGTILDSLGLNINDLKGIIDVSMGLSLNDSYWVVPVGFDGLFADFNLYSNDFSRIISLIAYTGNMYDTSQFKTSPELTTGGMLRKAWRRMSDGEIWLYKSGTADFANAGLEPYSEFYACQVAETMGLNAVHYELENWKHILASKCKLFTDINTAYIPIERIVKTGGIQACLDYYKELGEDFYQELISMIVFDAVVVNEDRHFGNFGLLRDMRTGEIIAPAPIFDNGLSLLCYGMEDDLEDVDKYLKSRSNPYGTGNDYMSLCKRIIGPTQREQLRRLVKFKFEESNVCNLPSWRIKILEELVRNRAIELLK